MLASDESEASARTSRRRVGILELAEWLLARLRAELLATEMDEAARLCVGRPAAACI